MKAREEPIEVAGLALFSPADDTLLFGANPERPADDRPLRPCVVLPDR